MDSYAIEYMPQSETLERFHKSLDYHHRFIMGPLGSAKTTTVCIDIFDLMHLMPADSNGVRRSRWAAVRNTYSELKDTTVKEWLEICPEELGKMNYSDMNQTIKFNLEDGTRVESEMLFKALDRPQDIKKLRGLQLTGGWLNEVKELPFAVVQMLFGRCGRYPRRGDVDGYWFGVIGDTNAPDEDHWYYLLAEEDKPEGWIFMRQPPGVFKQGNRWVVNSNADNLHNLPLRYYENQVTGNKEDWINVNLANQYGFVVDGKPVHPQYVDSVHCAADIIQPDKRLEIGLGFDFGRTPACAMYQKHSIGRYVFIDEFISNNMSAENFAPELKRYLDATYSGFKFKMGYGDPAGDDGNQSTDSTPFDILRTNKINAVPTDTNDPLTRRAAMSAPMLRNCMDGKPAVLISPKCKMLRKGLAGGFCYKRIQVAGDRFTDKPDKNEYSHIVEAAEYALQGEGEGRKAVYGEPKHTKAVVINKYNPMRRR